MMEGSELNGREFESQQIRFFPESFSQQCLKLGVFRVDPKIKK